MPDWTSWQSQPTGGQSSSNFNFSNWFNPGSNYGRTHSDSNYLSSGASGLLSGASTGATVGGVPGAIIGGVVGLGAGLLGGRPKELSAGEQLVNDTDEFKLSAFRQFAPEAMGRQVHRRGQASNQLDQLIGMGPPDLSQSQGDLDLVRRNVGQLSNYSPQRIDRQMRDWRGLMDTGVGGVVNPAMVASNQQYEEANKAIMANPNLTAQQKAQMQAEGRRGLAQTNAMQQGEMIATGMQSLDKLAADGDALALRAKEAASSIGLSLADVQAQLTMLPYNYAAKLYELLLQDADSYRDFLNSLMPGQNQYNAAAQGGRTGFDWMGAIQQGANIYRGVSGGGSPEYTPGFDWPEGVPARA